MMFSILVTALCVSITTARDLPPRLRRDFKPGGKVSPDTTNQCTYYYDAKTKDDTCAFIEGYAGVSHENFVAWVS